MSTRCHILVKDSNVLIYRHSDGYPDSEHGVLALLKPLVKDFNKIRGFDPFFLSAQITHSLITNYQKNIPKESFDNYKYLNIGIEPYDGTLHSDIAFFYYITGKYIKVYTPTEEFWNSPNRLNLKLHSEFQY